ncbi:MAG: glycosyl hydrolase family 18 protein [Bacilli bacterium]|nr:glycosyl hydrolase family 18 protein [Bacilli bacterium]
MKKTLILILLFAIIGILGGCKNQGNPPVELDYQKINNVLDLILLLPDEVNLDDEEDVIAARVQYDELTADEKVLITTYSTLLDAEATILALKTAQAEAEALIQASFEAAQAELMDYLPATLNENITLPSSINTPLGELAVLWSSSDRFTLSNTGITNPGRRDIIVTMTTTLRWQNTTYSFTQKVLVEKINFDPLPTSRRSFGYLYDHASFSGLRENEYAALDVVNYAFGRVFNGEASVTSLGDYQDVLALRKRGVRVVLCLGGYADGAVPFSEASRTAEGRATLARSIVAAIEQYHYDGVDIDWEYPGFYSGTQGGETNVVKDSANYTALMVELRTQLKRANADYILSAAVPGGPWAPTRFEISNLAPVLDFFHLMTYDMDSETTSTHLNPLYYSSNGVSGCSVHDTVNYYAAYGVPKNKLIVGIAFYGRRFYLSPSATQPMKQSASSRETIYHDDIVEDYLSRLGTGEVIRYFDSIAKAAYLFDTVQKVAISYEDRESIMYKAQYIIDNELGGAMFWEYHEDPTGELLEAVYDYLVKDR